jgi:hypothetical protein
VVPFCMNSTISTPFLSQKTVAISFRQKDNVCLKLFDLFGECVCILYFNCTLVSTFTNTGFITRYLCNVIENFIAIFVVSL